MGCSRIAAGLAGLALVAGGCGGDPEPEPGVTHEPTGQQVEPGPVTPSELAAADGQEGRPCLVAVGGTVYHIDGFLLWQDGEHAPSHGEAYCGADMSDAIQQAPHGADRLDLLVEVGPLQEE